MNNPPPPDAMPEAPAFVRRRAIAVAEPELVRETRLREGDALPLVFTPAFDEVNLLDWAARQRDHIRARLCAHGAVLFRGFQVNGVATFEQLVRTLAGELLEYHERSSPRHQVSGNVYTSTDYPSSQSIFLHNENSYQHAWPLKLFFFCQTAATRGGETPIADVRGVLRRISPATQARFRRHGVMYVRNYGDGLGLSWQNVFQTADRAAVDAYCRKSGIQTEWKDDERLRTRQVAQAVARHPVTGEEVWFNHAAFFHITTLDAAIRDALLEAVGEEELPNNTYYGDGSPIEPAVLEEIREAYTRERVVFPWREGDILLIDNMLVAHSRNPYAGPRKILVAMAEPFTREALAAL